MEAGKSRYRRLCAFAPPFITPPVLRPPDLGDCRDSQHRLRFPSIASSTSSTSVLQIAESRRLVVSVFNVQQICSAKAFESKSATRKFRSSDLVLRFEIFSLLGPSVRRVFELGNLAAAHGSPFLSVAAVLV